MRVHALDYLVSQLEFEDQLLLIDDVFDFGAQPRKRWSPRLQRRCRRNMPEQVEDRDGLLQAHQEHQLTARPDYFIRETDQWLRCFRIEVRGLTCAEIPANKPVDEDFFLLTSRTRR